MVESAIASGLGDVEDETEEQELTEVRLTSPFCVLLI
jgi:hypothetical protein